MQWRVYNSGMYMYSERQSTFVSQAHLIILVPKSLAIVPAKRVFFFLQSDTLIAVENV